MLPPHSATLTVSPIERVSRARFAVRTLAYVALRMPRMQTIELMHAPMMKVTPLVASTNSVKISATRTTTRKMVLYSVFRNVAAPLRMISAISIISWVPSPILRMRKKL